MLDKHFHIVWSSYKNALIPEAEPHDEIIISKTEALNLLKNRKALFIRYTSNFDQKEESSAYFIIKSKFTGLHEFSHKTRNQVRKAVNRCNVHPISADVLIAEGFEVYSSANRRRGCIDMNEFEYCTYIKNTTDREWFGCFDSSTGKLIAYAQNIVGEAVQYSAIYANPAYYKTNYPYYALFFIMDDYYLNLRGKMYICDGFRSLDNHSNIQTFLVDKFNYRKSFCKLHIIYKLWVHTVVTCLFPFRKIIPIREIKSLLFQEEISKSSLKVNLK